MLDALMPENAREFVHWALGADSAAKSIWAIKLPLPVRESHLIEAAALKSRGARLRKASWVVEPNALAVSAPIDTL